MILLDFSQIILAAIHIDNSDGSDMNPDFVRHICFNTIRYYNKKFRGQYGELVIAVDNTKGGNWRHEFLPGYKCRRKKSRDESPLDWPLIFKTIEQCILGLKTHFPYKVVEVPHTEADDIIGYLTHKYAPLGENIMIISSDHDFKQLHKFKSVKQYSPHHKKQIQCTKPVLYLKEHIIRGDRGDDVPNILTRSDIFSDPQQGERQKSIFKKNLEVWLSQNPEEFCEKNMLNRYNQNKILVDLSQTPKNISEQIQLTYDMADTTNTMYEYLMKHNLSMLLSDLPDFENSYKIADSKLIF